MLACLVLWGCSASGEEEKRQDAPAEEKQEAGIDTEETQEGGADTLEVLFLKCGKADAIVLSCGGKTMVIDAGEEDDGAKLIRAVKKTGADHVDVLVITHFDKDHVGGADALLKEMTVDRICLPAYEGAGTDYDEFMALISRDGCAPLYLKEDETFSLGDASVLIEPPASYEIRNSRKEYDNDFSLITTVTHGENRLVFMGDAEKERTLEWLAAGRDRTCDLIKVPHHGVYHKAMKDLARAAGAGFAVITDSDKNPADEKTLKVFEESGSRIFSTRGGSIRAVSDGKSLQISQ